MSYYLRAFCTADGVPTLGAVLRSVASQGTVLDSFVQHSDGLIQADGEGFYEADTLLLKLP